MNATRHDRQEGSGLYREVLLEHFRRPRNQGDLADSNVVRRGSNPQCGDEIEVGVRYAGECLARVAFRGRGCAVCIASASMMAEALSGRQLRDVRELYESFRAWFDEAGEAPVPPQPLPALAAVRGYPARRRCVLLAWDALNAILTEEPAGCDTGVHPWT
jgi:nitrogen fixation NifU-like protein